MVNLCAINNYILDFDKVKECLPIARRYINHEDEKIRTSACWCFAIIIKDKNARKV